MFVELDGFSVFLLWVGEEIALDVVAFGGFEDGLRAEAFVDEEWDRVNRKRGAFFTLICPFQPGLCLEGIGQLLDFVFGEGFLACFTE